MQRSKRIVAVAAAVHEGAETVCSSGIAVIMSVMIIAVVSTMVATVVRVAVIA
jgi:hypothetical protein